MAAQQAPRRQRRPDKNSALLQRLNGVLRARWRVAAARRKRWRYPTLIRAQNALQRPDCGSAHFAPRSMTANPFATSVSRIGKAAFAAERFGLMTTSTARCRVARFIRTASRTRRLIRFRWTEPPSARLTVNPTRGRAAAAVSLGASDLRSR